MKSKLERIVDLVCMAEVENKSWLPMDNRTIIAKILQDCIKIVASRVGQSFETTLVGEEDVSPWV